jgi:phosphoglycolate phosphatase-like HAD superfamily hydrolase
MRLLKNKKVAIFDTDKTLVDFTPLVNQALDEMLQKHFDGLHGNLNNLHPRQYAGKDMKYIIQSLVVEKAKLEYVDDSLMDDLINTYTSLLVEKLEQHHQPRRLVCPGVFTFLDALERHGVFRGVITAGIRDVHNVALEVTGLDRYFQVKVAGDEQYRFRTKVSPKPKKRTNLITRCLEGLKSHIKGAVPPENVAVFGDAPSDIQAANEYRAKSIVIRHASLFSEEELRASKPWATYRSFKQYEDILHEAFGIRVKQ